LANFEETTSRPRRTHCAGVSGFSAYPANPRTSSADSLRIRIPKRQVFQAGIRLFLCGLFGILIAGCHLSAQKAPGPFTGPSGLAATMPDPYNVHLHWKNSATAAGGNMVEFQMYPEGARLPADERKTFLILGFLDAKENTFRHENLGSETVFTYRIHPYFGNGTEPAGITTGSAAENEPEEPEGPLEKSAADPGSQTGDLRSIHKPATFAEAAPTGLTASLSSPTHVVLQWKEHAADADGYLVEISLHPDKDFQVCALLPPHTASFRKTGLPPDTKMYFRVRAFFYGPPSNRVTKTTGPEPLAGGVSRAPLKE